jgi:outer membrane protein assembly factor BamB
MLVRPLLGLIAVTIVGGIARSAEIAPATFTDPAPPTVQAAADVPAPAAQSNADVTFHAAPKRLPNGAVTSDWPWFLGPTHNAVSTETKLVDDLSKSPPTLVWEMKKGQGYASPAVVDGRLILFHRVADEEVVECLDALNGNRFWRFAYPTNYEDRYGLCDGPRSSPAVADGMVYTIGAQGKLHCLKLATGQLIWQRDLMAEFNLTQNFFGVGASPLIEGNDLIINVGAPAGPCVAGFDLKTGKMLWGAGDAWGPSYATPTPAIIHGHRRVLVFAGGESDPPTGGLLCIDPVNGHLDCTFPWRGTVRESVNASSPVIVGDRIFISECYGSGGVLLDMLADGSCKPIWTNPAFGTHFMSAMPRDGYLYGIDGHGPEDAFFVCARLADGHEMWRTQPHWNETVGSGDDARQEPMGTDRCTLIWMAGEGRCLCLGEYGHLLWLDLNPNGYKELSRTWLFAASDSWTPPVVSHGLLYVSQNQPGLLHGEPLRLLCYDLRAGQP